MNASRGAVLVESAITITILLVLIYGALQLGVIGFEQLNADGAAFVGAHQEAIGSADSKGVATRTFSTVRTADIAYTRGLAPTNTVPVDYHFDQPDARHGGFSVMQPIQTIGTVTQSNLNSIILGALNAPLSVSGISIEPGYREAGSHSNIFGYALGSVASFNDSQNYFNGGENTPPYFVGFNFMHYCEDTATAWNTCAAASADWAALGLAEYLDIDNWGRPTNGVTPGAVFSETQLHQNQFAALSVRIASAPDITSAKAVLRYDDPTVMCIYSWDSRQAGGYPPSSRGVGQFPLFPGKQCP